MTHLTDVEIASVVAGGGVSSLSAAVSRHLMECEECAFRLSECMKAVRDHAVAEEAVDPATVSRLLEGVWARIAERGRESAEIHDLIPLAPPEGLAIGEPGEDWALPAAAKSSGGAPAFRTADREAVVYFQTTEGGAIRAQLLTSPEWFGVGVMLDVREPPAAFDFNSEGSAVLPGVDMSQIRAGNLRLVRKT